MVSPSSFRYNATCFLYVLGLFCFLAACSPNFVTSPNAVSSIPSISKKTFTSYDNTELPLKMWLPADDINGVIIAVHGFNDYSNFIKDSVEFFNNKKLAIYSYDQRGFGETRSRGLWSGRQTLADDLATLSKLVKDSHPQVPLFILGDSMGGAVAIVSMAKKDAPKVNGVILIAPAVWARSEMPFCQRMVLWVAAHTLPWKKVTGESIEITASDNIEMLRALGKDPLVIKETRIDVIYGLSNLMDDAYRSAGAIQTKVLLLYGNKDEIIPWEPVYDFYKRLPSKERDQQKIILYDNGYHMLLRDLQAGIVRKDIVDWIYKYNKSTVEL